MFLPTLNNSSHRWELEGFRNLNRRARRTLQTVANDGTTADRMTMTRQHHEYQSVEASPTAVLQRSEQVSEESTPRNSLLQVDSVTQLVTNNAASAHLELPWRPKYLRRSVITGFLALFILVFITIEILWAISNQSYGIAGEYDNSRQYLWTYGPTAFLTIIAAIWGRVEYQSKMIAAWTRLADYRANDENREPKRTALLLDYVSTYQLWAVFKALRNKDFAVSITCAVAVLIKILIIFSTGLITLSWIPVKHDSYPVVIQDRFVDDVSLLNNTGTVTGLIMEGLLDTNLSFLDGLDRNYAFQSTSLSAPLSSSIESRVVVDGFENILDCQPANLVLPGAYPYYSTSMCHDTMNISLSSPGCDIAEMTVRALPWAKKCGGNPTCNILFVRFAQGQCDGMTGNAGKRILVLFGNVTLTRSDFSKNISDCWDIGNSILQANAEVHRSTQLLCTPSYTIKNVAVVRNGNEINSVVPSTSDPSRKLESISGWNLMDTHFRFYDTMNILTGPMAQYGEIIKIGGTEISRDAVTGVLLPYWHKRVDPDLTVVSLYESEVLKRAAVTYYKQFGAVLAKFVLMQPASISTATSVFINENRLVIQTWAAQWMAGLTGACILLTVVLTFILPRKGVLPCSPATIFGTASLLFHSRDLVERLRYSAAAGPKALAGRVKGRSFKSEAFHDPYSGDPKYAVHDASQSPPQLGFKARTFVQAATKQSHLSVNLHPVSRIALGLVLVGLVISLEITLRKSEAENGLGIVEADDTYIYYAWTTIPAVVFGLVSMVVSSIDFHTRTLAPFSCLRNTASPKSFMEVEFLDMSIPRVIWKEIRLRKPGPMAGTAAFLVASMFTIFATPLFRVETFSVQFPLTLQATQSFDTTNTSFIWSYGARPASLILAANLTYPKFTYEHLAFPEYHLTSALPEGESNTSSPSINTVLPAIRPGLECRLYDTPYHDVNFTQDYRDYSASGFSFLDLAFTGEVCESPPFYHEVNPTEWALGNTANTPKDFNPDKTIYFGFASIINTFRKPCSSLQYTWGKLDYSGSEPVLSHITTLGCNVTFQIVDVNVSLHVVGGSDGRDLDLDGTKPPQILENTKRDTAYPTDYDKSSIYDFLVMFPVTRGLRFDEFFQLLTSSRRGVPVSYLGDPTKTDEVIEAIKFQLALILTQSLGRRRIPAERSNAVTGVPADPNRTTPEWGNDAEPVYNGTGTIDGGSHQRRRVVQDVVSTRVLEGLLGLTLVLLVISWVLLGETRILASSPTSIAAMAALIGGGNLIRTMGEQVWGDEKGDIDERKVGDEVEYFWLGWGPGGGDERSLAGEEFGSDGVEGKTQFGIFAVRKGEEEMFKGYVALGGGVWKGGGRKGRDGETGVLLD